MENKDSLSFEKQNNSGNSQHPEKNNGMLSYLREIVFGFAGILLVFMLLFRVVVVSGPSMKQTLINGDCLLLLSNLLYSKPEYGDIVVVSKDTFKDGEPFIKRVIATQGQEVDIDFDKGIVYVDGQALHEPYTNTPTNLFEGVKFPLIVEEGCVFVMGDNRNESKDSRSTEIELVDCREILGRAIFLMLPAESEETGKRDFGRIGGLW